MPIKKTQRKCPICGKSYIGSGKTCSRECGYKQAIQTRVKKKPNRICRECGTEFYTRRAKGKYCSYPCFVNNGGTVRAGLEATKARMRYGLKKDANHKPLAKMLEDAGFEVKDLSQRGCGLPDMVVWAHGAWHLVEIKNKKTSYGKKGLNKNQRAWIKGWSGGPVHVICDDADAQRFIDGDLESLRYSEKC